MNESTDSVLALYRRTVSNMLKCDKPGVVPNSSHLHASIIIEELVKSAKTTFHAYCGRFRADVWTPEVTNALRLAIDRGVDVSIILAESPESTIPEFLKKSVRFLDLSQVEDRRTDFENVNHFASADGKSIRLENDRENRTALFAANHPEVAREIEQIFNILSEFAKAA